MILSQYCNIPMSSMARYMYVLYASVGLGLWLVTGYSEWYVFYYVWVHFLLLGNFLDQQSSLFREEFPQLASGGEEKSQVPKRVDENREAQRGPVLDPRHQGVCCSVYFVIYCQYYVDSETCQEILTLKVIKEGSHLTVH